MAIAAWKNMARPDGASPAQLFYNRRMKQLLPILPAQADTEEIDIHVRNKAAERAEKNSNKCTDPRERAKFKPGDRVTVQDPASKKWSTTAIVGTLNGLRQQRHHTQRLTSLLWLLIKATQKP